MMQSITRLQFDQAYYQIATPPCQAMIGRKYRIAYLSSAKGKTLNGKRCQVVGFNANHTANRDARLQCAVLNDDGTHAKPILLLKGFNLVPLEANVMQDLMPSSAPLSDEHIMAGLRKSLAQHPQGSSDRADLNHRIQLYRDLLQKLLENKQQQQQSGSNRNNALEDLEYTFPCGATVPLDNNIIPTSLIGSCQLDALHVLEITQLMYVEWIWG